MTEVYIKPNSTKSSLEEIYLDMSMNELATKITQDENLDNSFFVADLNEIASRLALWRHLLPDIQPFFAMKVCDADIVRRFLAEMGTGFDCASKGEIDQLMDLEIDPSKIIYANPVKFRSHIRHAASVGVHLVTFDCYHELLKISECDPEARLVVRIRPVRETNFYAPLGNKFGCSVEEACHLVRKARDLKLTVEGVSFHVGYACADPRCFTHAIEAASRVFTEASRIGVKMSLLDIGGGYPGSTVTKDIFNDLAKAIRDALAQYFPPSSGVRVIAEPGQFLVAAAFNLYTKVIMVKEERKENKSDKADDNQIHRDVYITDGLFGTFSGRVYPYQDIKNSNRTLKLTKLWGPTCDSMDFIDDQLHLAEVQEGDWIYFDNMGAYTISMFTEFNGFSPPAIKYVMSSETRQQMGLHPTLKIFLEVTRFCKRIN
ncbi:ornithine decarboxylase-like isoform X2 [Tachypleus tridentatus]|uniref:ornithine decarboxylase-like isoform X2 n=1 Tax=Tachypleus tridentatus TaxID=6853 RepID=UPI003FD0B56E